MEKNCGASVTADDLWYMIFLMPIYRKQQWSDRAEIVKVYWETENKCKCYLLILYWSKNNATIVYLTIKYNAMYKKAV